MKRIILFLLFLFIINKIKPCEINESKVKEYVKISQNINQSNIIEQKNNLMVYIHDGHLIKQIISQNFIDAQQLKQENLKIKEFHNKNTQLQVENFYCINKEHENIYILIFNQFQFNNLNDFIIQKDNYKQLINTEKKDEDYLGESTIWKWFIMKQLLYNVQQIHKIKILHLNLNLNNIYLKDQFTPIIINFQDSISVDKGKEGVSKLIGEIDYMDVELQKNKEIFPKFYYTEESDIYSLGVVFRKMLTQEELYLFQNLLTLMLHEERQKRKKIFALSKKMNFLLFKVFEFCEQQNENSLDMFKNNLERYLQNNSDKDLSQIKKITRKIRTYYNVYNQTKEAKKAQTETELGIQQDKEKYEKIIDDLQQNHQTEFFKLGMEFMQNYQHKLISLNIQSFYNRDKDNQTKPNLMILFNPLLNNPVFTYQRQMNLENLPNFENIQKKIIQNLIYDIIIK